MNPHHEVHHLNGHVVIAKSAGGMDLVFILGICCTCKDFGKASVNNLLLDLCENIAPHSQQFPFCFMFARTEAGVT